MAPLWKLCKDGNLAKVQAALARGEDVNSKNSNGTTALMHAVMDKHNSIVKLLLDQPAVDVNVKNIHGGTALHWAVGSNNAEGARMLLLHKDFNSANVTNKSNTALMIAVIHRKGKVLRELVEHQCVSLDVGGLEGGQRCKAIVEEAKRRRAQGPSIHQPGLPQGRQPQLQLRVSGGAHTESLPPASTLSQHPFQPPSQRPVQTKPSIPPRPGSNNIPTASKFDNDDTISECMRRCQLELEELQKHQNERVQLLLQQNEEKEQKLREENERALADLMEENKAKEALMIAKHEEEKRAIRKAEELEAERYAPSAPSHPCVPECPVCLEEMIPPTRIFQCRNGHLLCETCKNGLNPCICPKCRQEMIGRATDMENFLRSMQ